MNITCPRCGENTRSSPCDVCYGDFIVNKNETQHVKKSETAIQEGLTSQGRSEYNPELLIGSKSLSGYQFDSCLEKGGMGHTWRAHRISDGINVVIKAPRWQDGDAQLRFTREARALTSCNSPYVLKLLDIDMSADHQPLLILELISGETLRDILQKADMTAPEFERLACHIARAIEHCHRRGIIHRDIKPENIMREDDQYILIDFSLALIGTQEAGPVIGGTPQGSLLGTPPYTSPEQLRYPSHVTDKADIYSYGIVLRECLEHSRLDTFSRYRLKQWAHLIKSMCHHKAEKRPSLENIIHQCQIFSIQHKNDSHLGHTHKHTDIDAENTSGSTTANIPGDTLENTLKNKSSRIKKHIKTLVIVTSVVCICIVFLLSIFFLIPFQTQYTLPLTGSINPDTPDILRIDCKGKKNFIIYPQENTRIRLPGNGKWRRTKIHISNYKKESIEIHIIDSDGKYHLYIESY